MSEHAHASMAQAISAAMWDLKKHDNGKLIVHAAECPGEGEDCTCLPYVASRTDPRPSMDIAEAAYRYHRNH